MMSNTVVESDLTRVMLIEGIKEIWCAVDDDSDEQAMMDHHGNDFTTYIVSFYDGQFYCSNGRTWAYAVPIRISAIERQMMAS